MASKKYGLILPGKEKIQPTFQAKRNVFGNESDSDEELNKKKPLLRPSHTINRQAKITQEKAIEEDPTVYQYDEIYDSMASKKEYKKSKTKEEQKPQYIEKLLKAANQRKIENERRIERQIQKERENEGEEFADKEVFVTSAYKKKLEELKLEEEKEKREEYLESIGDVTKQRDLGGFYRHLYEQRMGPDEIANKEKEPEATHEKGLVTCKDITSSEKPESSKKRNYRKRRSTDLLSEGEIEDSEEEINRLNLKDIRHSKQRKQNKENIDADSDFSIDGSSDEESTAQNKNITDELTLKDDNKSNEKSKSFEKTDGKEANNKVQIEKELKNEIIAIELKPKIDIWKKRTVGEVFDQALRRYYERKAGRGM